MRNVLPLSVFFATSLLVSSCCNHCNQEMTRYHEDGRAKPAVAIASMIDTTSFELPWSLSEELTTLVTKRVADTKTIFVQSIEDFAPNQNPFSQDLSWVKHEFAGQEFVVFMELVQHELVPATKGKKKPSAIQETANNLNMAVRVRVLDLRGKTPKIVLQEMVKESYYIPRSLLPTDYQRTMWGSEEYRSSPMGIAHAQLAQEISSRLNDYILLAKSR
ncbi:MAG: CT253 family lipoprotein [Chlamydiales bacterium]|nr:CT253 family lipoprotein [Chlamydiales bacterium]